ncbi:MAG: HDOD domain-containing protein [Calditrichaeota bacterium]|nr:MAG: HDOD domain-containing protein [Calditrichota bacterium]
MQLIKFPDTKSLFSNKKLTNNCHLPIVDELYHNEKHKATEVNLPPIQIDSEEQFLQHHKLPVLPEIIQKLQKKIQDEDINITEISELVQSDPALSAQILKIVNSAYYSLKREVHNLKIAIAFLGINEIHRIILSLSVINTLSVDDKSILKGYWYASYYTAIIARTLATRFARLLDPEELWSAALLHDIGSLFYLKFYPKHFKAINIVADKRKILPEEAEKLLEFPASSWLGVMLSEHWRLPANVRMACEFHTLDKLDEIRDDDPHSDFKRVITFARLCADFTNSELKPETREVISQKLMEHFGLDNEEFLLLVGEIRERQEDVDRFVKTLF